ncbi:glutathione S-transferase [Cupriavidus gilardii J11]|uniref:Glutathione S-transferase n=1 Tax=Cupriavidus gilardii J11 TaxID=936133 RepID=A0A562BDS6_9BURK|nr:glutathione S-transferase [Cupriavidus gilardii]TWG83345.1 glutathione S-transferase [Cupriavidus gilardii J11]
MKLIGMLDSPYVRRVAVSLKQLGLAYEHQPVSVFRTFEQFQQINPVVKAPTLVCDNGVVLMDSTLILDYIEALAGKTLMPPALGQRQIALRRIGLALAAAEKAVQIVYEHRLRPSDKLHQPWVDRVDGQLRAALDALEAEWTEPANAGVLTQDRITTAVVWQFAESMLPERVQAARYPKLAAFSAVAEALPAFAQNAP